MVDSIIPSQLFYGSVPDALALDDKWTTQTVIVNGLVMEGVRVRTEHGRENPVATAEIEVATEDLPLLPLGARVEVEGGYGSAVGTIFKGQFYEDYVTTGDSGGWSRVLALGDAHRLTYPSRRDIIFGPGQVKPLNIFKALCAMRGVQNYVGEEVLDAALSPIFLGGVAEVNEGRVTIEKGTNLLGWMNDKFSLFEYYVLDQIGGGVELMRFLNPPPGEESGRIYKVRTDDAHVILLSRERRATDIINDWMIEGASWTVETPTGVGDETTSEDFAIRSFPLAPTVEPLLPPLFYQHQELQDDILVTQELADAARNAKEIRYGALTPSWSFDHEGDPTLAIGTAIRIIDPSTGDDDVVWVTDISQDMDEAGYWMTVEAWAGAGAPQPRGDDTTEISLMTGTVHLGDEYLTNYRVPSPNGNNGRSLHKVTFTVPEEYTSLRISGFWHGCNNLLSGEITASRFEFWQGAPLKMVADGQLPRQKESLTVRYGAGYDTNWTPGDVPMSGKLEAGPVELRIISGQNDDFEVRGLTLKARGTGAPIYPVEE